MEERRQYDQVSSSCFGNTITVTEPAVKIQKTVFLHALWYNEMVHKKWTKMTCFLIERNIMIPETTGMWSHDILSCKREK